MNGLAISNTTATCTAEDLLCFGMKDIKTSDLSRISLGILPERTAVLPRVKGTEETDKELRVNRMMAFGRSFAGALY
jgi:hypothetical protein